MDPHPNIHAALADEKLQTAIYSGTARLANGRRNAIAEDALPDYQELRQHAHDLKRHTLDYLDFYLEQLQQNVEANGGKVIWANSGVEACDFIQSLARERGVKLMVKSKSMVTEEIHLNRHLEHAGVEAVETDLGEYIIQLSGETPYHIIAPALHKTREQVAEALGEKAEATAEQLTSVARARLREKFLAAGIGITGANFLIADSGAIVIVENEGNARLTSSAPRIHIAVAGIEKIIPRAQDLGVFLNLLGRSATGQPLSVYTSLLAGARRAQEPDGPDEFYLVLLDNGRTKILADKSKRESLYCIRCGACLNACPVYRKIGGYSYPWVYSGPIGKILTPQFMGRERDPWLPFASSLCGACGEVCPVKIEIPRILLELRREIVEKRSKPAESAAFRMFSWVMRHPRVYEQFRWVRRLKKLPAAGPLKAWLSQRDLPDLPQRSFREAWRERKNNNGRPELRSTPRAQVASGIGAPCVSARVTAAGFGPSRNQLLAQVRDALGREPGDRVATAPLVKLRKVQTPDRLAQFSAALTALGGIVIKAADEIQAKAQLESMLTGKQFVASEAPVLKRMGVAQAFSRDACAKAGIGVTSADYALAATGTLVFLSQSGESRLISLLPKRHIAVIERAKILASLDELLTIVPHPGAQSSAMVLVTGPSRTADIEMRLVRGVHGPGEVAVLVVG